MSIQFDTQRLREEQVEWSEEDEKALQDMANQIMDAIKSGKLDRADAQDIVNQMFGEEMDEQSTSAAAGAYLPSLHASEKKYKGPEMKEDEEAADVASKFNFPVGSVKTADGKVITVQDAKKGVEVYYYGLPYQAKSIYEKGGKKYMRAYSPEKDEYVDDVASRFKSMPPKSKEVDEQKDVEPKLAAGKIKTNIAVKDFGYKPAPSIPNRKSKMIDYKQIWEESLNESYAAFRNETKNRSKDQQFHEAVKTVKKNLVKMNTMFEYLKKLKEDLGEIKESKHTSRVMEQITEKIKSLYVKAKTL
jgi:hypothetical protein